MNEKLRESAGRLVQFLLLAFAIRMILAWCTPLGKYRSWVETAVKTDGQTESTGCDAQSEVAFQYTVGKAVFHDRDRLDSCSEVKKGKPITVWYSADEHWQATLTDPAVQLHDDLVVANSVGPIVALLAMIGITDYRARRRSTGPSAPA